MSYAVAGMGQIPAVSVGSAARGDAVLAKASLEASKILLQAAKRPAARRPAFVERKLDAMRLGLAKEVAASRRRLLARGKNEDQAIFDAMRLAIANMKRDEGIESLKVTAAQKYGAEAFSGLGQMSANDRATACTVTAGAQVAGGIASIIPVYGTIVGGIVSIGSSIAGGALDCGREARDAAAATAQAQANLEAAQRLAAEQTAAAEVAARSRRMRNVLIGGVAIVGVLGAGWFIMSD